MSVKPQMRDLWTRDRWRDGWDERGDGSPGRAAWSDGRTDPWVYTFGQRGLVLGDLGSDGSMEVVALDYDMTRIMRVTN